MTFILQVLFKRKRAAGFKPALHTLAFLTALLSITATSSAANTLSNTIEKEFETVEKAIEQLVASPELKRANREEADEKLRRFTRQYPMVRRILRTNAEGVTINDITAGVWESGASRSIAHQNWFITIKESKSAYFSSTTDDSGTRLLFWAWPYSSTSDPQSFSGAIAVHIDLAVVFALLGESQPFQINYDHSPLYRHDWQGTEQSISIPLEIKGSEEISLEIISTGDEKETVPAPQNDEVDPTVTPIDTAQKDQSEAALDTSAEKGRSASQRNVDSMFPVIIIVLMIIILLLFGAGKKQNPANRSRRKTSVTRDRSSVSQSEKKGNSLFSLSQAGKSSFPPSLSEVQLSDKERQDVKESSQEQAVVIYKKAYEEMANWVVQEFERLEKKVDGLNVQIETLTQKLNQQDVGVKKSCSEKLSDESQSDDSRAQR
ncbi:hypothetical protein QA601_08870 [Chitinispirillales bacterium ANBcel5]|uniref:hypothetical protein n=1 Tax=Cellulosispirillum alkaliphilum TaxID=3039283 RepID=UPI002A52B3B9|nr:hypothetical protein [Chitinispirillales bacterium ANBcel5]